MEVKAGKGIGERRERDRASHWEEDIYVCFFYVIGVVAFLERPIPFSFPFSGAEIRSN